MKHLILAAGMLMILVTGFQNCARGTDTGNPNHGSASASQGGPPPSLHDYICQRLAYCHSINFIACSKDVWELQGLAEKFGSASSTASLKDIAGSAENSQAKYSCMVELYAITCADPLMQGAYDANSATPYAGVLNLIPQNGKCPEVY